MSEQQVGCEFGHEACRACIDEFTKKHSYEECRIFTLRDEYEEAFVHMYGDSLATCGKRDLCWECVSYFDARMNGLCQEEGGMSHS